ncbi:MAG: phage tail protein, partial [Clostridia bacterium]|nr:phage tail protein [Clostridia bacterium]
MLKELFTGGLHADSASNMGGLIVDRIPKPRVSAMDNLLTGFNFILSLNEFTYGFQSISNIQRHREVRPEQEGGVNDHTLLLGAPNDNNYTLQLRRGYIIHAPDEVINKVAVAGVARIPNEVARKAALIAINASSPQAALENGPAPGFIQVYSRRKKLVAMFSFLSLGMTEWSFSNLDAQSSDALFEDITIAHTGLTLLPATWLPSTLQPVMGWMGATEDSMATMTAIMEKNKEEFEKRQKKIKELEKQKKALDDERINLLHKRDEILAERAKKAEEKKKEVEDEKKAKLDSIETSRKERAKTKEEEAKKSEEARKEAEKAKE